MKGVSWYIPKVSLWRKILAAMVVLATVVAVWLAPPPLRITVLEQRAAIDDLTQQGESLTQRLIALERAAGTYADDDYEVSALPEVVE